MSTNQSVKSHHSNNSNTNNNQSKYFDEVNHDTSIGAYSNEELFRDCERSIQQQYGLKPSSPFRDLKFHLLQEVWMNICKYIYQQVENIKSVSINNIGRFSFITSHLNTGNNGIIESKKLVFVMSESFVRDFNLKVCKSYRKFVDNSIPTLEVNYFLIAQQCCTRKEIVMLAVKMFRNRLGEIMSTGKKVLIEFDTIGQLKSDKRIVGDFEFCERFKKPMKQPPQSSSMKQSMKKKFNRIMTREDLKLSNKMSKTNGNTNGNIEPPNTSRSMIHSTRSSVSGGSIRNPFTIIHNSKRPLSSSSSMQGQFARGNGVNAVRNIQHNQQQIQPHPPSNPRPPSGGGAASLTSSQRYRLTRESLETLNQMNYDPSSLSQQHQLIPSDYVDSQFSPSMNYGPYDNGFRQPNPAAAKTVMSLAVKRFENELESSRKHQQQELDDFYRQLIHNVCVSSELRKKKKEEASTVQNTLLNQMNHTGAKRHMEDRQYCNFFLDEKDQNLDRNVNAILMGFKKSKNNNSQQSQQQYQQQIVSKSLPSIPSLQAMKPLQKIMLNENNPIEKGLRIPDKNELYDYYNEFN